MDKARPKCSKETSKSGSPSLISKGLADFITPDSLPAKYIFFFGWFYSLHTALFGKYPCLLGLYAGTSLPHIVGPQQLSLAVEEDSIAPLLLYPS